MRDRQTDRQDDRSHYSASLGGVLYVWHRLRWSVASEIQDSHDFATRRQLVRSVIQDIGPSLVASIVKACMFDLPRSMVRDSTDVF